MHQGAGGMILIRPARETDAEVLSTLLYQLGHPSTPEHIRRQLARFASSDSETVLVADVEGRVAGLLALQITRQFHQAPPLARIIDLCVLNSHRGRHIGQRLIKEAERIALKIGCDKLEVTASNFRKRAHQFYQRNGLEPTHRYFAKRLSSSPSLFIPVRKDRI
jgi:ribosomal protein S18 acetylase RimI-like enzyme